MSMEGKKGGAVFGVVDKMLSAAGDSNCLSVLSPPPISTRSRAALNIRPVLCCPPSQVRASWHSSSSHRVSQSALIRPALTAWASVVGNWVGQDKATLRH